MQENQNQSGLGNTYKKTNHAWAKPTHGLFFIIPLNQYAHQYESDA